MFLLAVQPIMVRVVEAKPVEGTSMAQLILTAIGVVGLSLLAAALLGGVLGGILIGVRQLRARYGFESATQIVQLFPAFPRKR
ncbi:MAG: hypothetical protein DMF85_19565 [Acidobacteria bacterium]|nr:MAG: hypothetical protein DMF85_19565 [Acidobacteriota bacterium]PYR80411.1 MAG: hypothetical protein DMF86_00860 [Acidobacteriota bacterium]